MKSPAQNKPSSSSPVTALATTLSEITVFKSFTDIEQLPGYVLDVDPDKVQPVQVVGGYKTMAEGRIACGLKSCHQKHLKGLVLKFDDGNVTNVGHLCGSGKWEIIFDDLHRDFKTRLSALELFNDFEKRLDEIDSVRRKLSFLWSGKEQASDLIAQMDTFLAEIPSSARNSLLQRSKNGDGRVHRIVSLTATERSGFDESASGGKKVSNFREELVGTIVGLKAVSKGPSLRRALTKAYGPEKFREAKKLSPEALQYNDVKRWNKWLSDASKKCIEVEAILDDYRRFLVASNCDFVKRYWMLV